MPTAPQSIVDLPGIKKLRSGKVREVFDLGDTLLFVVTNRLSAFDVILPDPIPEKGAVLNQLSAFWFKRFDKIDNHFVTANFDEFPEELEPFHDQLTGRSMIVRKTKPLTVECVVRGYLAGSGWKEYRASQSVCGIPLPKGLQESSRLPEPIFTPSTKAEAGHDENISFEEMVNTTGAAVAGAASMAAIFAYACGERRMYAKTWPGKLKSAAYRPLPVSSRTSSRRGTDLPMPLGANATRDARNDINRDTPCSLHSIAQPGDGQSGCDQSRG